MAHRHCQRYVKNLFRFGCIDIWQYWNTLKYPILVHIEQYTCNNACFVILGHYGCPRGFLPKPLPVIVHWAKKCFETILWLKTQERHAVTALFLHLPWFSSYLQHCPKTENWLMIKHYRWVLQRRWNNIILPSRYGVLLTFLRLNITRITLWNNFSGLCIKFRNKTWRQIRYLGQNITNLQISTFDANMTPGMCKKDIL